MPRLINTNPAYRKHKPSGQAVVTLDGRDRYLGPHGTRASKVEYDRLVGEWLANGRRSPSVIVSDLTVTELVARYWAFAIGYYRDPDGRPSSEQSAIRAPLTLLAKLYGHTPPPRLARWRWPRCANR